MDRQEPGIVLSDTSVTTHTPDVQLAMKGILSIPNELLLDIQLYLSQGDRCRLMQTCRNLLSCLVPILYDHDSKEDDNYALWWACSYNKVLTAEIALSFKPELVNFCFKKDHLPDGSLKNWAFRKSEGASPLSVAISRASVSVVQRLIDGGAHVNTPIKQEGGSRVNGLYPINVAMELPPKMKLQRILKILVQAGADINQTPAQEFKKHLDGKREGEPPIFGVLDLPFPSTKPYQYPGADHLKYRDEIIKSFNDQLFRLEVVLGLGANPNTCGGDGHTPLMRCISRLLSYKPTFTFDLRYATGSEKGEQRQIVHQSIMDHIKLLVRFGANVNAMPEIDDDYFDPLVIGRPKMSLLRFACRLPGAHEEVIRYLVEQGSDINAASSLGRTAIYEYCDPTPCTLREFRWFVRQGVNVNHQDEQGRTPLHHLCLGRDVGGRNGGEDIVKYAAALIEHGADFTTRDFDGKTAEDYAARMIDQDTKNFLKRKRERCEKDRRWAAKQTNRAGNKPKSASHAQNHPACSVMRGNEAFGKRGNAEKEHHHKTNAFPNQHGSAHTPHTTSSSNPKGQAKNKNFNKATTGRNQKQCVTDQVQGTTMPMQNPQAPSIPSTRQARTRGRRKYNNNTTKGKGPAKENNGDMHEETKKETRSPTPLLIKI